VGGRSPARTAAPRRLLLLLHNAEEENESAFLFFGELLHAAARLAWGRVRALCGGGEGATPARVGARSCASDMVCAAERACKHSTLYAAANEKSGRRPVQFYARLHAGSGFWVPFLMEIKIAFSNTRKHAAAAARATHTHTSHTRTLTQYRHIEMSLDAKALKEKATELYKKREFSSAVEAFDEARKAASSKHDVDVQTLAVLHANKAAALLACGGRGLYSC
jgi:hypothetical protein